TCGLYVPNVALYQAEPHAVTLRQCTSYNFCVQLSMFMPHDFSLIFCIRQPGQASAIVAFLRPAKLSAIFISLHPPEHPQFFTFCGRPPHFISVFRHAKIPTSLSAL
ncbi:MAG: hypothetical protein NC400_12420, partial [Clostridium sp.]|nr:hypothetical protein [Clostridium sp.]